MDNYCCIFWPASSTSENRWKHIFRYKKLLKVLKNYLFLGCYTSVFVSTSIWCPQCPIKLWVGIESFFLFSLSELWTERNLYLAETWYSHYIWDMTKNANFCPIFIIFATKTCKRHERRIIWPGLEVHSTQMLIKFYNKKRRRLLTFL